MQSADIIATIAEIAITLVGFSAIIVVLNPRPLHDWGTMEKHNFRILIQVAAVACLFAILPFATHVLLPVDDAWRVALLAYGAFHVIDLLSFLLRLPASLPPVNLALPGIGALVAAAQIATALLGSNRLIEFVYLAALVWHLSVAFMAFVILVYGARTHDSA